MIWRNIMLNFIPTKDSICQEPILHLLMKVLSGRHADTLPSPWLPLSCSGC